MAKAIKTAVKAFVVTFLVVTGVAFIGGVLGISALSGLVALDIAILTATGSLLNGLFSKGINAVSENFGTKVATRTATAPRQIIYGKARVGGTITHIETSGTDNYKLSMIVVLAGHEVESLEEVLINDTKLTTTSSGGFQYATNSRFINTDNENNFGSGRLLRYKFKDGSQTTADSTITGATSLGSSDKFIGMAYMLIEMVFDSEAFGGGIPPLAFVIKGKKVYDPRTSTTAWSDNPALCVRDYITDTTYGLKATSDEVLDTTALGGFASAANTCDGSAGAITTATVNGTVSNLSVVQIDPSVTNTLIDVGQTVTGTGISGTVRVIYRIGNLVYLNTTVSVADGVTLTFNEELYKANGITNMAADGSGVLEGLLSSCAGKISYINGKFVMFAGASVTPDMTITDDNLLAPISVQTKNSGGETFNTVKAVYVDANNNYVATDSPVFTDSTLIANDTPSGESQANYRKTLEIQLPFTDNTTMAQRLQRTALLHSRQEVSLSVLCNIAFMQLQPFDWVYLTNSRLGYTNKTFEVLSTNLEVIESDDVPILATRLVLKEIDSSVYSFASSSYTNPIDEGSSVSTGSFSVTAPTNLSVSATLINTGYDLQVQWTNNTDDLIQGTEILYGTSSGTYISSAIAGKGKSKEIIPNVKPNSTYYIVARHFSANNVFSAVTSEETINTNSDAGITTPSAPTSLSATTGKPLNIGLSWTNPSNSDLRDIKIYRSTSSGFTPNDGTNLVRTIAGVPSVTQKVSFGVDDGLVAGTTYYFKVKAVSFFDKESSASSQASGSFTKVEAPDIDAIFSGYFHVEGSTTTALTDAAFNTAHGRLPIEDDILIMVNTSASPKVSKAYKYSGTSGSGGSFVEITNFQTGDLVVDGTIAGAKIIAGDINADRIEAGTLTSDSGVFGSISANDIDTGTLNAANVTVSGGDVTINNSGITINGSSSSINLGSGAFTVSSAGVISATSGTIGGVTLATNKIHLGTGTFNNSNTAFYVDTAGQFSLKDKLSFNGADLVINGKINPPILSASGQAGLYSKIPTSITGGDDPQPVISADPESDNGTVILAAGDPYSSSLWTSGVPNDNTTGFWLSTSGVVYMLGTGQSFRNSAISSGANSLGVAANGWKALYLHDFSSFTGSTSDALYNIGGSLYFNGSQLGTGSGDITGVTITTTGGSLTGGASYSSGNATFTLDIGSTITGAKTFDNNVVIQGNLDVQGTTTTIDTTNLDVKDKNITLNYGTGDTSANANGAGITIQDAVSAGNDATLTWNATDDNFEISHGLDFGDNSVVRFGASNDLEIKHTGNHSYITDTGTGNLYIRADSLDLRRYANTEQYLTADANGAVTLFYNGEAKLATTSTGINVTGNIGVTGTVDGRDIATDGTKLDGIEAGATTDQTQAEINALGITAIGLSGTPNITVGTINSGAIDTVDVLTVNTDNYDYGIKVAQATGAGYAPASILLEATSSGTRGQGIYHYNTVNDKNWFTGTFYNDASARWGVAYKSQTSFNSDIAQVGNALFEINTSGNATFAGEILLEDANTKLSKVDTTSNRLKIQTPNGYTEIGAGSSTYSHFYTDRTRFYFSKRIIVDTGIVSSYNEDLVLQRAESTVATFTTTGATFAGTINSGAITASADISVVESSDAKVISNSVGDYFPSLEIKRTSGVSKTNYHWSFQMGSSGFLNLVDATNSYYPIIFKNNGDVAISNDTDSTNPVLLLDKSAESATFAGNITTSTGTITAHTITATNTLTLPTAIDLSSGNNRITFNGDTSTGLFFDEGEPAFLLKGSTATPTYVEGLGIRSGSTNTDIIDQSRNLTNIGTISSGSINSSGTGTFDTQVLLPKQGTATSTTTTYESATLVLQGSGWDTNGSVARTGSWTIKNVPTASIYPDFDLNFYEEGDQLKFQLHGRGTSGYVDPLSATFHGNVNINADSSGGSGAGAGNLTVAGTISSGAIESTSSITSNTFMKIVGASGSSGFMYIYDRDNGTSNTDGFLLQKSGNTAFVYNRESSGSLSLGAGDTSNYLVIDSSGNIDLGSTQILDQSRNLTNIGTISSGAIDSTSSITGRTGTFTGQNGTALEVNSGSTNVTSTFESGDATAWINLKDSNSSTYGTLLGAEGGLFRLRTNNNDATTDLTVDTSGNLSVSGTIDSGAITSSGLVTSVGGVVNTNTGSNAFYVTRSGATNQALKIYTDDASAIFESIQDESADDYGNFIFAMDGGTTEPFFDVRKGTAASGSKFRVDGSGALQVGSTNTTFLDSSRNLTNIGTISSDFITADHGIKATDIWTSNEQPSTDNAIYSGYGAIGNRGTFYITNGGGGVQIGNGATHNANPTATFSTGAVNLGANRVFQMNGQTVIDASRNITATSYKVGATTVINSSGQIIGDIITQNIDMSTGNNRVTFNGDTSTGLFYDEGEPEYRLQGGELYVQGLGIRSGSTNTDVIDSSRNLVNIATVNAGTLKADDSGTTPSACKLHVGAINSAGSSAIAQFGGFIRAAAHVIVHSAAGTADSVFMSYTGGDVDFRTGEGAAATPSVRVNSLKIGTSTVIDSSANLINIGTINSGAITSSGNATFAGNITATQGFRQATAGNDGLRVFGGNSNQPLIRVSANAIGNNSADYGFTLAYRGDRSGNENSLAIYSDNQDAASQVEAINIKQDGNTTFSGTISSGAITVDTGTTSGTHISLTRNGGTEIGRVGYSATDNVAIYGTAASHAGLNFVGGAIIPMSAGAELDNAISLGDSTRNFSEIFAKGMTVGSTQVIDASRNIRNVPNAQFTGGSFSAAIDSSTTTALLVQRGNSIHSNDGNYLRQIFVHNSNADYVFGQFGTALIGNMYFQCGSSGTIFFNTNGSTSTGAKVDSGGNFIAQGNVTAYGSVSDIRRKENVEIIPDALEKLKTLDGITFNFKDRPKERMTGVIAQQVEKILPEAVYETTTMEDEETKAVHYGNMVGLLIEAIKEQQQQIDELKARLDNGSSD